MKLKLKVDKKWKGDPLFIDLLVNSKRKPAAEPRRSQITKAHNYQFKNINLCY